MKRYSILLFLLPGLIFGSCLNQSGETDGRTTITVSTLPQKTFVSRIAGDNFDINVLIPEDGNHETYEPTAKQMVETGKSVAYFKLGYLDFELNWLGKVAQSYPDIRFFDTSEGLDLIREQEIQHGDHTHPGGIDPHIWLSVSAAKVQAKNIMKGLSELDPDNSSFYEANYEAFLAELDDLDISIRRIIGESGVKSFMIYHPSLGYFARDYGLEQIAIEQEGKEPSPRYMKQLIETAGAEGIKAIIVSNQFNKQSALTLAGQLNARVEEFNPVSPDWEENMLDIAAKIAASNR